MREIKFRAKRRTDAPIYFHLEDYLGILGLKREAVSQLIGVDANGMEVYEGDAVIRRYEYDEAASDYVEVEGYPMKATFDDYGAIANGEAVKCQNRRKRAGAC